MTATTISARPPDDPLLDWSALVAEGRAMLEAMTDESWTDFNLHDPGITILELFCYALTDLGYRMQHPIADLVAGGPRLLGPSASLTTQAVTLADMRRVGLDVAGVRNVWIEPSAAAGVRLRYAPGIREVSLDQGGIEGTEAITLTGVHSVAIEKSSLEDLTSALVARDVAQRLHAERSLCEDFDSFTVLEPQAIVIVADVEIDDPGQADAILLDIFARLDRYMSPRPDSRSVLALRQEGLASDAIYDGPLLTRGVTSPSPDAERRRILHLSDIIAALAQAEGVRATRRVRMGASFAEAEAGLVAWSLTVSADRVPGFDLRSSRIRLLSNGAVALDSAQRSDLARRFADDLRTEINDTGAMRDQPSPAGRDRRVAEYRPLRFDLPNAYGLRPGAAGRDWPPARHALANQLRAYLGLFDALLANGFAQLAGASTLLSADVGDDRSYFAQPSERLPDEAPIHASHFTSATLQDLVEVPGSPEAFARLGRFLAHLLARFGENVPAVPHPIGGASDAIAGIRRAFLRSLPRLTAGRGSGANLLVDGDESSLLERIRLKLGLAPADAGRLLLVEHILLRGMADDAPQQLPLLAAAARADPYSLQLSFVLDAQLSERPDDADSIARVLRDESPAHLVIYVHWLPSEEFAAFAGAHARWMAALRRHRREQLGLPEETS